MTLRSHSIRETGKTAAKLARKIEKVRLTKQATVIALEGELGAGKTTFVKAFAKALGVKAHITSPTFVLLRSYQLSAISYRRLIHIDAYRLKNYRDLLPLGIKEAIANPENIIMIEWSERVRPILPKKHIQIHIDHIDSKTRKINIL